MSSFFLSCVTNEFRSYRQRSAEHLARPGVEVEIQEKFLAYGDRTLLMLDDNIQTYDAVIHLVGDQAGSVASPPNRQAILGRYSYDHLQQQLGLARDIVDTLTYTQWEAWLAVLHGRKLYICTPAEEAIRDAQITDATEAEAQRQAQQRHLELLRQNGRYAENPLKFADANELSIALLRALHHLLPPVTVPIAPALPPSIGSLFKGRADWLTRLRDALRPASEQQIDAQRVAVWGVGGIGKTRLAVEYAHTFGHEHSALLVVSANTPEDLRANIADLAGCLKLAQAASTDVEVRYKAALDWLDDPTHRGWFLLIDNVDDATSFQAAEAVIRRLHHGRVVITGRIREWPEYVTDLHLNVLGNAAASAYLLEATAGKRIPDPASQDQEQAGELARKLDGLALALVQAKGAICKRNLSFADYLSEWETRHDEVLDDPDFDPIITGYPRTVAATWRTSYDQLPPASKLVFDALCWLAPDPIPERLIAQPWPDAALNSVPEEHRAEITNDSRRLLLPLYDFCLAEAPENIDRCCSVHRLVQDVGRIWQRKAGTSARLLMASALVEADFVREGIEHLTLHILPQLRQLAPHVLALLAAEDGVPAVSRCNLHRLLSEMRWHEGLNSEALHHGEQAVSHGRGACPSEPHDHAASLALARALCHLVFVLVARGETTDALARGEEALELTSGWEQSGIANQQESRAWALQEVGRVREKKGDQEGALQLFEESRKIRAELCDREPDNLAHQRELGIALNNVGRVREKKGDQEGALQLFEESRKISAELCDREPDNLAHQRDLGIALENVGRVREKKGDQEGALKLFEASRKITAELCDREPDNLAHQRELGIALNNVGRVREKKGDQEGALQLFEESRKIRAELCDREPDNLAHQRELGIALENVGRVREKKGDQEGALQLFEESRKIRAELCDREPDNLAHQRELGIALENVGRVREKKGDQEGALKLFEESRKICAKLCDREPDNLAHQRELGIALAYCGRVNGALGNKKQAVSQLEQAAQLFRGLQASATFGDTDSTLAAIEFELLLLKKPKSR